MWWFLRFLEAIFGWLGPGIPTSWQSSARPKNTAWMLRQVIEKKAWRIPTEHLSRRTEPRGPLRLKKFTPDWSREIFNPYDWNFQSRLETFNPDWKFQTRLKLSIPTLLIPHKKGPCCVVRLKFSISIENFDLRLVAWRFQSRSENLEFFQSLGPLGILGTLYSDQSTWNLGVFGQIGQAQLMRSEWAGDRAKHGIRFVGYAQVALSALLSNSLVISNALTDETDRTMINTPWRAEAPSVLSSQFLDFGLLFPTQCLFRDGESAYLTNLELINILSSLSVHINRYKCDVGSDCDLKYEPGALWHREASCSKADGVQGRPRWCVNMQLALMAHGWTARSLLLHLNFHERSSSI